MKIETQPLEDHQVKLLVDIEPDVFDKFKHRAARKISQESKVPGFRPGKAPYDVIRRLFGEESISTRALDLLVDETYPDIIKQADVKPSGPGKLQKVETFDPPKLEIVVPLQPEVDLGEYKTIRLDYTPVVVQPDEVEKFIERLRTNYASVEPVERPVQEGDLVFLNVSGNFVNVAEGESSEYVKETPQQVIVQKEDEQKNEEWPFPGFTRQLIGLSANDEKTFSYTYPEDAKDEKVRGKEIEFHVKIQTVKAMKLPELNDEFAQTVGEFESVDAMHKSVQERLEQNAREEYDQQYYTQVIDKIREHATLKYPPQVLEEEMGNILQSLERDLSRQKLDMDTYLKIRKMDRPTFLEQEVKPSAIRRLERSLIIDEITRAEKLELDPKKLEGEITETVNEMQLSGELKKARKSVSQERLADAVAYEAAARLMNREALDRLKEIATGKLEEAQSMTAPETPQTEEGESKPVTEEVEKNEEPAATRQNEPEPDEPKPAETLGDTSAES